MKRYIVGIGAVVALAAVILAMPVRAGGIVTCQTYCTPYSCTTNCF